MIDQGLLTAAIVYAGVLFVVGVGIVLALGVWAARPSVQHWAATRDLRRTADALGRSGERAVDAPRTGTPHHAH